MTWVVSYGGGTNSSAILLGMFEKGLIPSLIMFADTGNEKPETYAHLNFMHEWCLALFGIGITTVKNGLPQGLIDGSLYDECFRLGTMPSKTFGNSSCSMKWKVQPQIKYLKYWMGTNGITHVNHVIGYDADEINRMEKAERTRKETDDQRTYETNRYLLIEWDWGRDECVEIIAKYGFPQPGKSACFMCPSSKKPEVLLLKKVHPLLYQAAAKMEARAIAGEGQAPAARVAGLGRNWNWATFVGSDVGGPDVDCGCYDGD